MKEGGSLVLRGMNGEEDLVLLLVVGEGWTEKMKKKRECEVA